MRRFATPVLLLLLPLAAFLALFHPATLDIGNAGWLIRASDNGENALGIHAWLHEPTTQLSPRTTLLNAPDGVAMLFTDSNPLVATIAKPFAPLLPVDAQLIGPWVLLCLVLNAVFAWLLLRRHAPDPVALWIGVVLLAFPPTLGNRFIHTNLMAHWTILAALLLFLDRERGRRFGWWAALIIVTELIHSYLLIMVGAIWASTLLREAWRGGWKRLPILMAQGAAMIALVVLVALWLGVGGDFQAAGNYGAFAMPLDALWNPGNPSYSNLLPAIAQREGRGFEGFQYLGAGGLVLVAAGIWAARRRPSLPQRALLGRLRWLVPALVVLTLLAISNSPDIAGIRLPRLHLPPVIINKFDAIRASGRMFWPVGYVIVLVALLAVYRLRDRAGPLLAAILLLQLADTAGMARAIRKTSAEAGKHQLYARTIDPRWDKLIADARDVAFMPGEPTQDLALYQEVAWRAINAGRPVTSVYAARISAATAKRLAAEEEAFVRGELVPGRLYIILPGARLPPAGPGLSIAVDNVTLIPASSPR